MKKGDRKNIKVQKKEEERKERKRIVLIAKEKDRCTNFRSLIYVRVSLFEIPQLT